MGLRLICEPVPCQTVPFLALQRSQLPGLTPAILKAYSCDSRKRFSELESG
jgi:hypothetical protein